MKKPLIILSLLAITIITGAYTAQALGTLTPSGTAGDATQYTLNDIYTKLTTNTSTSTKTGQFSVPGSVSASFRTLAEIYAAIPTIDATKVATGTTYLGVAGTAPAAPATLTWQTDPSLYLCWDGNQSGCTEGNGELNGGGAIEYCANLTTEGSSDWRLPTIGEYQSITDFTTYNNATQVPGFAQDDYYWSSTEFAGYPSNAWFWYTYYGSIDSNGKDNQLLVRCVH